MDDYGGVYVITNPYFYEDYIETNKIIKYLTCKNIQFEICRLSKIADTYYYARFLIYELLKIYEVIKSKNYLFSMTTHTLYIINKKEFFRYLIEKQISFKIFSSSEKHLYFLRGVVKMEINEIVRNCIASMDIIDVKTHVELSSILKEIANNLRVVDGDASNEIEKAERILGIALTERQKEKVNAKYEKTYEYDEEKKRSMNQYANVLQCVADILGE